MSKIVLPVIILVLGLGTGAGASLGTSVLLMHGKAAPAVAKPVSPDATAKSVFVPVGAVKAPVVFEDGRLAGYVVFNVQLEVPETREADVTAALPLLLNAINMRTFKTPMAQSPDGRIPDLDVFRTLVVEAGAEAFGHDVVRRALITEVGAV